MAIRNMCGTKSKPCNKIARLIWEWPQSNNVWITMAYISGSCNMVADAKSKFFRDHLEWSLHDSLFQKIVQK